MIKRKALRKLECWNAASRSESSSASSSATNPSQQEDTPNVSRAFNLTVQANSYTEIRSKIIQASQGQVQVHLLHPNRERVEEALCNTKTPTTHKTHLLLISKYFDHSETASQLCLHLLQHAYLARASYAPLQDLFLAQPDCDPHAHSAFRLFLEFDAHDNPIPSSHAFTDIRGSLSELKTQLDSRRRRRRFRSRVRRFRLAVACGGGAWDRRELARLAQLDAAAKCAYVLSNDLGTIDRLVARLCAAVEGDRGLVRLGLERGREGFPMEQMLMQLRKSYASFLHQLEDLEEHVCLCFYTVNKARTLLLQQICSPQTL